MAVETAKGRMAMLLQEKQKAARLQALRRDTLRKSDFLKRKSIIEYHDVYNVVREFFKEFLEKRYEFTISELRLELRKVYISNATRTQIATVLDRLEAAEYATVHYTREDLAKILEDFQGIVRQLVHTHTSTKSFVEHIKAFFFQDPEPQTIIAELPVIETPDAYRIRIYTLIEKCYIALDKHNLRRAKAAYEALLQEYNGLDEDHKEEYYAIIQQTYHDLINRAKMLD